MSSIFEIKVTTLQLVRRSSSCSFLVYVSSWKMSGSVNAVGLVTASAPNLTTLMPGGGYFECAISPCQWCMLIKWPQRLQRPKIQTPLSVCKDTNMSLLICVALPLASCVVAPRGCASQMISLQANLQSGSSYPQYTRNDSSYANVFESLPMRSLPGPMVLVLQQLPMRSASCVSTVAHAIGRLCFVGCSCDIHM